MSLTLGDVLPLEAFKHFRLIAGEAGLKREIESVGMLDYEMHDMIEQNFKTGEFVVTTLVAIKDDLSQLEEMVERLIKVKASGFAIKTIYMDQVPASVIALCEREAFPLFLFEETFFEVIITAVNDVLKAHMELEDLEIQIDRLLSGDMNKYGIRRAAQMLNRGFLEYVQVAFVKTEAHETALSTSSHFVALKFSGLLDRAHKCLAYKGGHLLIITTSERTPDVQAQGLKHALSQLGISDGGAQGRSSAGIESFGRTDLAAADAEMLALGLEATSHYGIAAPEIRMGDVALFSALIAALDLAPAWKRRLIKDFNRKTNLAHDLEKLTLAAHNKRPEYQGVLAALTGSDPKGAQALVSDLISIAGIATVGGRTVDEIAERFLEQAALGSATALPQEMRALIERFLAIAGSPDQAAAALRALAADAKIALGHEIELLENRTGFIAARGIDVGSIRFSTSFGRGIDYYTGVVFELHDPATQVVGQLVAGGRYDGLLTRLGAKKPIPAVGFAVWIDRVAACGGAP